MRTVPLTHITSKYVAFCSFSLRVYFTIDSIIPNMFAAIIALSLVSASAFQQPSSGRASIRLADSAAAEIVPAEIAVETSAPAPAIAVPAPRRKVQWIPINMNAPIVLDGTLAGDVGFDPLGLGSKNKQTLFWMREAEIKHARLAMLAAVGWPISELWHKEIAGVFGWESILQPGGRAPSLLNGGLSNPYATSMLIMSIIFAGYLEGKAMNSGEIFWNSDKPKDYTPGDFGFDPLSLYKWKKPMEMQTAEIKNGRLAMLAITGFAFSEFINQESVVSLTPFLF